MDQKIINNLPAEQKEQIAKLKEIYNDGEVTLPSGNTYKFTELNYKKRLKIFTRFQALEEKGIVFFDSDDFEVAQNIIDQCTIFDKMQLSKLPNHWDSYTNEMLTFYTYAMGALSYPFFPDGLLD